MNGRMDRLQASLELLPNMPKACFDIPFSFCCAGLYSVAGSPSRDRQGGSQEKKGGMGLLAKILDAHLAILCFICRSHNKTMYDPTQF